MSLLSVSEPLRDIIDFAHARFSSLRPCASARVFGLQSSRACASRSDEAGAALIIILSFMVMLLGLMLAFFSQSTLQQQVSKSSAGLSIADVFARGALASIIGDLKQEIIAGSTITTNVVSGVTNYVYAPYTYSNGVVSTVTAMPAISGFNTTNGLENLLKISAGGSNFFPSTYPNSTTNPPANRASTISTTIPSRNGRYVSPVRWNEPLLIARSNPASTNDLTPTNTFTSPQWIYVSRNGANPTAWNTNLTWSTTNSSTVIGRYAYAIYHEGGLLDANVAGYPPALTNSMTSSPTNQSVPYKQGSFFADLTQIGLTGNQILALVGWRNNISGNASGNFPSYTFSDNGVNYASNALANTNGFLQTYNNGTSSDHQFTSRQQLIAFLKNADPAGVTTALNSLQYLATFTRSLEQPSLIPPTNRPAIVNNPAGAVANPALYQGGNDNYGNDNVVNPNFLSIRVTNSFTRNDGSTAVVGEPLVKQRFDLRQLCWLTWQGPSSGLAGPDITQMNANGISTSYLNQGTAANITKAFGLRWNGDGSWTYSALSASGSINTLAQVAALGREANFFELLKASINAGSVGKSSASGTSGGALYQHKMDITSDYQILQIGANIMDQNDCDGYPTRIQCNFGGGLGTREVRGIENLPSLYRMTYSYAIKTYNYPFLTNSSAPWAQIGLTTNATNGIVTPAGFYPNQTNYLVGGSYIAITNASTASIPGFNQGSAAFYANPNLWNIHDQNDLTIRGANYALGNPRPGDGRLAVTITYASPSTTFTPRLTPLIPAAYTPTQWAPGCYLNFVGGNYTNANPVTRVSQTTTNLCIGMNSSSFALTFGDANGTLYREPTVLWRSNIPSGSSLTWYQNNITTLDVNDSTYHLGFPWITNMYTLYLDTRPIITGSGLGKKTNYALVQGCQLVTIGSTNGTSKSSFPDANNGTGGSATISCQFFNSYGWQTYDEKYWDNMNHTEYQWFLFPASGGATNQWPNWAQGNGGPWIFATMGVDPRSGRFSTALIEGQNATFLDQGANGSSYPNNSVFGTVLSTNANLSAHYIQSAGALDITFPAGGATAGNKNWNIMFQDTTTYSFSAQNPAVLDVWAMNSPWLIATNNSINYGTKSAGAPAYNNRQFNADPDGVVRRAMGAYVPLTGGIVTAPTGVATVTATTNSGTSFTNAVAQQSQSRPIVLNRPFRTVDELGYTFRGTPYKNLDFFTPESGDTGLLDTFCVGPNNTNANSTNVFSLSILSSGKVNLNTRQTNVLMALVSGALANEFTNSTPLTASDVTTIATNLVARTTGTQPWQGPLANVADLAGRFVGYNVSGVTPSSPFQTNYYSSMLCSPGSSYASLSTNITYAGLSADLGSMTGTSPNAILIQRLRQAGLRPFVTQGQTRVWNLMIDLVAQTGRFAPTASSLDQFVVEGESHFWLHVAIDRFTGQILDSQIEPVTE